MIVLLQGVWRINAINGCHPRAVGANDQILFSLITCSCPEWCRGECSDWIKSIQSIVKWNWLFDYCMACGDAVAIGRSARNSFISSTNCVLDKYFKFEVFVSNNRRNVVRELHSMCTSPFPYLQDQDHIALKLFKKQIATRPINIYENRSKIYFRTTRHIWATTLPKRPVLTVE